VRSSLFGRRSGVACATVRFWAAGDTKQCDFCHVFQPRVNDNRLNNGRFSDSRQERIGRNAAKARKIERQRLSDPSHKSAQQHASERRARSVRHLLRVGRPASTSMLARTTFAGRGRKGSDQGCGKRFAARNSRGRVTATPPGTMGPVTGRVEQAPGHPYSPHQKS
jgi:hypothetical protein